MNLRGLKQVLGVLQKRESRNWRVIFEAAAEMIGQFQKREFQKLYTVSAASAALIIIGTLSQLGLQNEVKVDQDYNKQCNDA